MGTLDWVNAWIDRLGLSLMTTLPAGVAPGNAAAMLEHSKKLAVEGPSDWKGYSANVDWTYVPGMPVFTTRWRTIANCSMEEFLAFSSTEMMDMAKEWDETYINAESIETHGSQDKLDTFGRLVKWRFKMPCPFSNREMLYLVVPVFTDSGGCAVCYLSVESEAHPCSPGYVRAYNWSPSFDYARPTQSGIEITHAMTTNIGGWVPNWVWNQLFRRAVLEANVKERQKVKSLLEGRAGR